MKQQHQNIQQNSAFKQNHKTKHILFAALAAVLFLLAILALHNRQVTLRSPTHITMGTYAQITVVAPSKSIARKALADAFEKIYLVDSLMSDYDESSEISKVNQFAASRPVKVSPETFAVLQKSLQFSKLTNGAFDITVGAITHLLRNAKKTNTAPTAAQIKAAQKTVGYQNILLDQNAQTVLLKTPGTVLDLGGIAKGYAIDLAVEALKSAGALGGMVNIGGDIRCFGTSPNKKTSWKIAIQDPRIEDNIIMVLNLADSAVATSGDYRRYFEFNGKRLSHIINPDTGSSADALASVSIIAPTAAKADALATAVSVMGKDLGLKLINSITDTEAVIIDKSENILCSTNAEKFIDRDAPAQISKHKDYEAKSHK